MIVYLNSKYLPREQAWIDVEDRGFLFADGVYEVIHSYEGKLFKLDEHLQRLQRSASALRMKTDNIQSLSDVAKRLITENDLTSGGSTVYIELTRGSAPRMHAFPPTNTPLTVYASAARITPKHEQMEKGIAVILVPDVRWSRCDIKTVALVANVLAQQHAIEVGATEAIFVRDGVALEGTASNFFGIFNGEVITAPKTNYILPGITRDVVLNLCKSLNIPHREAPIFEHQLPQADELFIASTTSEITPIIKLNGNPVANGMPGSVTRKLQKAFRELIVQLTGK